MFETDKIKKRGHSHTLSFLFNKQKYNSILLKFIWSSNEAHLILGRMYLKLRRNVSGAASGRICYYVGTYKMLRRDAISGTPKTPEYRYFYGNIWQIMAIKKLLQYRYIFIIKQLPNYMAIWQFFYEKNIKVLL